MRKIVEIEDLSYTYPDGTKSLKGINLAIYENESVGIIGPNGAGKSTLLLHLNGILNKSSKVKVDELIVNDKNIREIRKKVGLVFQNPDDQLFMPTVFDDVAFGPLNLNLTKDEIIKRVEEALELVDLVGYEEKSSHHLSFGEKKRISLATILSMRPRLLVLDEPSSNLDPRHRKDLINILKRFDNVTKIIATHDLKLVSELCQRVILLDKGQVVTQGKTESILTDKRLLTECELI